jgi:uncharacterized protein DUF6058
VNPVPTEADVLYIHEHFVPLVKACAEGGRAVEEVREAIAAERLPAPSYVLEEGTEMVPRDYLALADEAGGVERLHDHFAHRYLAAGGPKEELGEEWQGYLSGLYGVCLNVVTPENIVRKTALVREIETLLADPRPDDSAWTSDLRIRVDELDELERPFAPHYDRARMGPSSRDRCITEPRRRFLGELAADRD